MAKKSKWYTKEVSLTLEGATADVLGGAAFQIEAEAKINIRNNRQIDTGFMLNSVWAILPEDADPIPESQDFEQATNDAKAQNTDAEMGNKPSIPASGAAAGVGASYAVYNEMRNPFMWPAIEATQQKMGGIVDDVAKKKDLK